MRLAGMHALVATLMLGTATYTYTALRNLPSPRVDLLQLQAFQGNEGADWRLWAAASAGNARALHVRGQMALASQDPASRAQGLRWLERAARLGETDAALDLGRRYFRGLPGEIPNYPVARKWLEQASSGQPAASYYLALMDRNGLGGHANPAKAMAELQKAAGAGVAEALFLLGNAYQNGDGVARDERRAIECFERAAAQEHPGAMQALALAYARGESGVPRDESQSRMFFNLAADALREAAGRP